jgi:hypothetical protein
MAPASFPEIESPSLRKSGVVLESEELRSSAIGPTSRDVGHATNLLNDNSSLIVIGGQKTLHFGSGAGDGAPESFGKGDGITFLCFPARFSRKKTIEEVPAKSCRLRRSTQHSFAVHLTHLALEFSIYSYPGIA